MARTQSVIATSLKARFANNTILSPLLNDAQTVAIYNQIIEEFAGEVAILEQLFDIHNQTVNDRVDEILVGSTPWYAWVTKNIFQYSDTLVFNLDKGSYGYAVNNDLLKIVALAASENEVNRVIIKCAKLDSLGDAEPLTAGEISGLEGFWTNYIQTGNVYTIISQDGDEVYLQATIEYDANVINSAGQLLSDASVYPVEDAINEYYKQYQIDNNFNSTFYVRKLEDSIQGATGVKNVVVNTCQIKPFGGAYSDVLATSLKKLTPTAGWVQEDSLNPLNSNLTYIQG